jgi:OOP family OmpA-OmpF porin
MTARAGIFWLAALCPGGLSALTLDMPANAVMQAETVAPQTSYDMPIGAWAAGTVPKMRTEGDVRRQAWRINAAGLTTLQILTPLRVQLVAEGFDILFECDTVDCGGFDFRFGSEVLGPPDMQINLGDFRYLSATRTGNDGTPETVSLWVSRTARAGYVQVTRTGAGPVELATSGSTALRPILAPSLPAPPEGQVDFATRLETEGHVVLSDLAFDSGSAQLAPGPYASLTTLAEYLASQPARRVALVGHTDSSGSLENNIALSKQRAGSVLERLVSDYGVNRQQLDAAGMGYLAPIAANITPEGREENRRVEVILTSIE